MSRIKQDHYQLGDYFAEKKNNWQTERRPPSINNSCITGTSVRTPCTVVCKTPWADDHRIRRYSQHLLLLRYHNNTRCTMI